MNDVQLDLTDLVDTEHISGSMPAADDEREAAAQAWYAALRARQSTKPPKGWR
jgi:hypothetical protein